MARMLGWFGADAAAGRVEAAMRTELISVRQNVGGVFTQRTAACLLVGLNQR